MCCWWCSQVNRTLTAWELGFSIKSFNCTIKCALDPYLFCHFFFVFFHNFDWQTKPFLIAWITVWLVWWFFSKSLEILSLLCNCYYMILLIIALLNGSDIWPLLVNLSEQHRSVQFCGQQWIMRESIQWCFKGSGSLCGYMSVKKLTVTKACIYY